MFKKVLIAEDIDNINEGIKPLLINLNINNFEHVQYCDDAVLKIKRAIQEKHPFDLVISDLSFKKDHREQTLNTGEELIAEIKRIDPTLKIIGYSIEDRPAKVNSLFEYYAINGYVCKDRKGLRELSRAIKEVYWNNEYISAQLLNSIRSNHIIDFENFDSILVSQLAKGLTQEQISRYLKQHNISPSSISSVEKRLTKLKLDFKAHNATHLVAITKDLGLI